MQGMHIEMSSNGQRSRGDTGVRLVDETRSGLVEGGVPVEVVQRGCYDEARIRGARLVGRCELSTFRDSILESPIAEAGAHLIGCDMEGVLVEGGGLQTLSVESCSLREARVQGTSLGSLLLCDLRGARLEETSVDRLVSCRLEGATLIRCELGDVSDSSFRGAKLVDCSVGTASGADFTGVRGLAADQVTVLRAQGAHYRRWIPRPVLAAGALLALGGIWISTAPGIEPVQDPIGLVPTQDQREASIGALNRLRERIAHSHDTMVKSGAVNRTWPTIRDLQQNRYDMDGDGPQESWDLLSTEGLPKNLLTRSDGGVIPFCKEEPVQTDLTGVDTDWYYCELNGRLLAAAGFSGEATLNW